MIPKKIKVIFFDLDGVLYDSLEMVTACINDSLKEMGEGARLSTSEMKIKMGVPLHPIFRELIGPDEAKIDRAIEGYVKCFRRRSPKETKLMPGVIETLEYYKSLKKVAFTKKARVTAEKSLEAAGIMDYFAAVEPAKIDDEGPSKVETLGQALKNHGDSSIVVGDRKYDIEAAKAHQVAAVGISSGYGGREELEKAGADFIVGDLLGLTKIFDQDGNLIKKD